MFIITGKGNFVNSFGKKAKASSWSSRLEDLSPLSSSNKIFEDASTESLLFERRGDEAEAK